MRISSRLLITAALPVLLVGILVGILYWERAQTGEALRREALAGQVLAAGLQLEILTRECATQPGERPEVQWQVKASSLKRDLDALQELAEAGVLLQQLRGEYDALQKVFPKLVMNRKQAEGGVAARALSRELRARIAGQLIGRCQALVAAATEIRQKSRENVTATRKQALQLVLGGSGVIALLVLFGALLIRHQIVRDLAALQRDAEVIAGGELEHVIATDAPGEVGSVARSILRMVEAMREVLAMNQTHSWFTTGEAQLANALRGENDLPTLCADLIACLAEYVDAQVGAVFVADARGVLRFSGGYAFRVTPETMLTFQPGEGLVGEAARQGETLCVTELPADYPAVSLAAEDLPPREVVLVPFHYDGSLRGVIELATLETFTAEQQQFLEQMADAIGIAVEGALSREREQRLLEESQRQTEELQTQQEELSAANTQLQTQRAELEEKQEELRVQQEELTVTNEELEERMKAQEEGGARSTEGGRRKGGVQS